MDGVGVVAAIVVAIAVVGVGVVWVQDRMTRYCPNCGSPLVEVVAFTAKHSRRTGRSGSQASVIRVCKAAIARRQTGHFGIDYGSPAYKATKLIQVEES